MRLFQPTWRDRDGTDYTSDRWTLEFRFGGRRRPHRLGLFKDKRASEEAVRRIAKLIDIRQAGGVLDADSAAWMEQVPARIAGYLAKVGVIDGRWAHAAAELEDHVRDFAAALKARGNTSSWVNLVAARVRRVFEGCRFRRWSDISASKVERFLADRRADKRDEGDRLTRKGLSIQTSNFLGAACKQFMNWAVQDGRVAANPLAYLKGLNVRTDRRHDRRALTVDELRGLLETTEAGPPRQHIHGSVRAMLYCLAVESGLRANELRSLTRASFRFDGPEPTVRVEAGYSKRRREDVLPLRPSTAHHADDGQVLAHAAGCGGGGLGQTAGPLDWLPGRPPDAGRLSRPSLHISHLRLARRLALPRGLWWTSTDSGGLLRGL